MYNVWLGKNLKEGFDVFKDKFHPVGELYYIGITVSTGSK